MKKKVTMPMWVYGSLCLGFAFFGIGWGRLVVHWYPPEFVFGKELTFAIIGTILLLIVLLRRKINLGDIN